MLRFVFLLAAILLSGLFTSQSSTMPGMPAPSLSKPLTLQQVWLLNSTYTDQQHGVTFRYPSVWKAATQFGYHPPALVRSELSQPVAGFTYEEDGFPRHQIVGPYTGTNLEGVGFVYSVLPTVSAGECETKAASLADDSGHSSVTIADRSYSVYGTGSAGMSQSISGKLYATYSAGSCYLFETGVAITAPGLADNIQSLTPAQSHDINTHLWSIMKTVRIIRRR